VSNAARISLEKASPRSSNGQNNLNSSIENYLKSPTARKRSSIHQQFSNKAKRMSDYRKRSDEYLDFSIENFLPEYEPINIERNMIKTEHARTKWYHTLRKHMNENFNKASLRQRKARFRIYLSSNRDDSPSEIKESPIKYSQNLRKHQPYQKKSVEKRIRDTICYLNTPEKNNSNTNTQKDTPLSARQRQIRHSKTSNISMYLTKSTSIKLKYNKNSNNGGLLGFIDPLGNFVIKMHESYTENLIDLLKLGFLQKMAYENKKKEYFKSLEATICIFI